MQHAFVGLNPAQEQKNEGVVREANPLPRVANGHLIGIAPDVISVRNHMDMIRFVYVEGRRRFTVNVRYKEDFRATPEKLRSVLVPLKGGNGAAVPLGDAGRRVERAVEATGDAAPLVLANPRQDVDRILVAQRTDTSL